MRNTAKPSSAPTPRSGRRPLRRTTSYTAGSLMVSRWTKIRFYIVGSFLTLCFFGVAYRAYGLQVRNPEYYRDQAERQHLRTIEVAAPRGNIYDTHGIELAGIADVDSVFVNPRAIVDVTSASESLAKALDMDVRDLEGRLAARRYFAWIKRHVTPEQADKVRKLAIPGVSLAREPRRFYPGKALAGHILGFAGVDGRGLDGLELTMDEVLTGRRAQVAALRDASGQLMVDDPHAVPTPGASLTLTIDRTIQFAAERAVREAVLNHKAKSAVAVIMDVKNGDLLAMASYPEVDPNNPGAARSIGARNRALTDSYEVGSVMKVFTIAAALESKVVSPSTVINTEYGQYRMGRKVFHDSFHDASLDVGGVMKRSSNVGALKIGAMLGASRLHAALKNFGFGETTGVELPGEVAGVIHDPKSWGELGLATHSFGYGMTSTPLQVTAAMASIGNHGIYNEPRVIKEVTDGQGLSLYKRKSEGRRVLSEQTTAQLIPMLESVFEGGEEHGTARGLFVEGYRVGGKTGTAHKIDPETHKYGEHLYLSSFSGIAPSNDPRIAVTVLIDEPHGDEHYGGKVAGPAWIQIVQETMAIIGAPADAELRDLQLEEKRKLDRRFAWRTGIDPDKIERERRKNEVPLTSYEEALNLVDDGQALPAMVDLGDNLDALATVGPLPAKASAAIRVPDFTGMGLARALKVARAAGLQLELVGSGSAIDQSPPPGPTASAGVVRVIFTPSDHAFAER